MMDVLQTIFGEKASLVSYQSVPGGDSNAAYKLELKKECFFLKLNDAKRFPDMFLREAQGLRTLAATGAFTVPEVLQAGVAGNHQFLLLQWIERSLPAASYWEKAGEQLAALHRHTNETAGFFNDNYIGSLPQQNTETGNWCEFYAVCRLQPLIEKLLQTGAFTNRQLTHAEQLYKRLPDIFPNEKHSLLHGDLWSGNVFPNEKGLPVLVDPAVYYGHREMDIGMTALFGGFGNAFYEAYHYHYPLETLWQQRLQLTQLYPLLVHAVLFGGDYISETASILAKSGG
ncbi:MAG: fructosamine kinase family protein [Chitinophagaceae bacterium]|nr:fructosamine kinase family protein [Chitinophagaceae bacterium]